MWKFKWKLYKSKKSFQKHNNETTTYWKRFNICDVPNRGRWNTVFWNVSSHKQTMKTPRQCLAWWLPKHDLVQFSNEDRVYEEPVRLPFLIKWCFQNSICPGHFYERYTIGIIWKGDSTDLEDIEGKFIILILFLPFNIHHLISAVNIFMSKYRVGSLRTPERIFNLQTWVAGQPRPSSDLEITVSFLNIFLKIWPFLDWFGALQ